MKIILENKAKLFTYLLHFSKLSEMFYILSFLCSFAKKNKKIIIIHKTLSDKKETYLFKWKTIKCEVSQGILGMSFIVHFKSCCSFSLLKPANLTVYDC